MLEELGQNLSPLSMVLSLATVLVAAVARGYAGFGFSTIIMVSLVPIIPVSQLVPLSIALEIVASSAQARRILADINRQFLTVLLVASLIGTPVGVLLLSQVSERILQFLVYGVIFSSTLLLLYLKPKPITISPSYLFMAGLVAGAVNGATALSGLVLALFFTSSTVSSPTMRATMIAYLFFTDIITGGFLLVADRYDAQTILYIVVALPFLLAGILLGTHQFVKTPSDTFKNFVMWLLLIFCALGAIRLL